MKHNRFCVLLITLVMVMTAALPVMAEEEEPELYESGDYTYILLEDGTAEIVGFSSEDELSEITIPAQLDGYTVSSIDGNPFRNSEKVETFIIAPGNPYFAVIDGVLVSKADRRLIAYPRWASETTYSIPQGIKIIGDEAFYYCYFLKSINISDGVTFIGEEAFWGCGALENIVIPDGITCISDGMFVNCYSLQSISIPNSVTAIGDRVFSNCHFLQNITIPNGVTSIGSSTFHDCDSLQSIAIPDSVTSIGDTAFESCNDMQSVTIPASVTFIGENAFYKCTVLTLTVERDSYAETYAISNGLTYIYPDTNDWLLD